MVDGEMEWVGQRGEYTVDVLFAYKVFYRYKRSDSMG